MNIDNDISKALKAYINKEIRKAINEDDTKQKIRTKVKKDMNEFVKSFSIKKQLQQTMNKLAAPGMYGRASQLQSMFKPLIVAIMKDEVDKLLKQREGNK